jgi:hypothetical protein
MPQTADSSNDPRTVAVSWLITLQLQACNFETLCLAVHYMDQTVGSTVLTHSLSLACTCLMLAAKFVYEPEDFPLCLSQFKRDIPTLTRPVYRRMERAVLSYLDYALWSPGWSPYSAARYMCHCLQFSVSEKMRLQEWFRMWLLVQPQLSYYDDLEVACAGVWTAMQDHCWPTVSETAQRLFRDHSLSRIRALKCALTVVLLFNPDQSCHVTHLRSTL